jgi:hypothetical protein
MINEEKKKKLLNLKLKGPSTVDESFLGPGYESYSGYESYDDVTLGGKLQIL